MQSERKSLLPLRSLDENGTILSSFLGIMSTMAGAGVLALPGTVEQLGQFGALLLLFTLAMVTWASIHMLCVCGDVTKEYSYEGLNVRLLAKYGVWSTRILTLVLLFMACVMYMVIALDLLAPIFLNYVSRSTIAVMFTLVAIPMCLPTTIYSLRYTNGMVMICLVYITLAVGYRNFQEETIINYSTVESDGVANGVINQLSYSIPIQGLSFGCQLNQIRAYGELQYKYQMKFVNGLVVVLGFLFYAVFALLGYHCFDGHPPGDVLAGFSSQDTLINGARVSLALCMLCKTPITFQPFRDSFEACVYDKDAGDHAKRTTITTIGFLIAMTLTAILTNSLSHVMDFMGAFAGLWIAFSVPGLYLYKVSNGYVRDSSLVAYKIPAVALITSGFVLTILSLQYVITTTFFK